MEPLNFEKALIGKKILITGHTGFTGTWATTWLKLIGADLTGISLDNSEELSMQKLLKSTGGVDEYFGDITNLDFVTEIFKQSQPQFVLHLAAQPIVIDSYQKTFETVGTNSHGTAVMLEACNLTPSVKSVVCVTTDKVYQNLENNMAFCESDYLEGKDPYSSSKVAAEHVIRAYSYMFQHQKRDIALNIARGGNIVGGGDYSNHRIVPDIVRAIAAERILEVRNLNSTRPWQHVISLLHGYFLLLARSHFGTMSPLEAWNFGPNENEILTVGEVLNLFEEYWILPKISEFNSDYFESKLLRLDSSKSKRELDWHSPWTMHESIIKTIDWYREIAINKEFASQFTISQIEQYRSKLAN